MRFFDTAARLARKAADSVFVVIAPAPRAHRPFDMGAVRWRDKGVALEAHLAFGVIALDIARHFLGRFKRLGVGGIDIPSQPHQGADRAVFQKAAAAQTMRCGSSCHPPRCSAISGPSALRDGSNSIPVKSRAMRKA